MKLQSPLRRWEVLAGLCQSLKAKHLVEVGCKDGATTGFLLANLPELHVTAVDPWCDIENAAESYSEWNWKKIEQQFWKNVGENTARCRMLRKTSLEASKLLPDDSIDIAFIDAAHDYENVMADIHAWYPKLKKGGLLVFHDYQHKFPGVHRAIAECFCLLQVSVMPDSIAVIQKNEQTRLAA